jgi:hypothetical protein
MPMPKDTSNDSSAAPDSSATKTRRLEFLELLLSKTSSPMHRRIIEAYRSGASVQAAEKELAKVLSEVINEDY